MEKKVEEQKPAPPAAPAEKPAEPAPASEAKPAEVHQHEENKDIAADPSGMPKEQSKEFMERYFVFQK